MQIFLPHAQVVTNQQCASSVCSHLLVQEPLPCPHRRQVARVVVAGAAHNTWPFW